MGPGSLANPQGYGAPQGLAQAYAQPKPVTPTGQQTQQTSQSMQPAPGQSGTGNAPLQPGTVYVNNQPVTPQSNYDSWRGAIAAQGQGMIDTQNNVPVAYDPNDPAQMARYQAKYGTTAPKGWNLPQVRVPGVDFNQGDFNYYGGGATTQGDYQSMAQAASQRPLIGNSANWYQQNQALQQGQQGLGMIQQGQQGLANIQNAGNFYQNAMNGTGPNLAQTQLQGGIDQSIRAQQALAASAQGGPLAQASAMRAAAGQGDAMRAQAVNQSAQLAQQQQFAGAQGLANAGQSYGNLAGSLGQGYGNLAAAYANQYGNQQQAMLGANVASQGQNLNYAQALMGMGQNAANTQFAGQQAYATNQAQADLQTQMGNANLEQSQGQAEMGMGFNIASGALNAGAGAVGEAYRGGGK